MSKDELIEELVAALRGMEKASEEIAVEFIEHKRATNWGIVNNAYVAASQSIARAERDIRKELGLGAKLP